MSPLAIKCYLPGRRTQYVLQSYEDLSIELGAGADLCPHDFDSGVRMQLRSVDEQWFVTPQLGALRREDGTSIEGPSALSLPAMLLAGSTTVVLDQTPDPRIPARVIQGSIDSARQLAVAPPQPPLAKRQPRVAALRAPSLAPLVEPSVVVRQAERPAVRELTETRVFDMAQFGAAAPSSPAAVENGAIRGSRALLERVRKNPRLLAYAVLGVGLVAFQLRSRVFRAPAPAAPARVAAAASAASSSDADRPLREQPLDSLPGGEPPRARRAAELFAVGDLPNALRQYRALSAAPNADPVFAVIAHALEQRLAHPQAKR